MNIRLLDIQDTKMLEDFLNPYKSQCMFICSNLKSVGIKYHDSAFHGEYYGSFNDSLQQLNGVIVHYWNGNIMMFAHDITVLDYLVTKLKNSAKRPIAGILGPDNQAELVIKELGLLNEDYNVNSNEGLYELNLSSLDELEIPVNFNIVSAKSISKNLLITWMKDYEIEALGADDNFELQVRAKNKLDRLINNDSWVLIANEIPVSLCAFNAKIDDMIQVGPVWTPPKHRNQGFARLLLTYALIEAKRKSIKKAILFTDNPSAIKAYKSVGFRIIGNYRLALLKKPITIAN